MKGSIRSALAVVAGFLATAIASMAADATMHAARIFPSSPGEMSNSLFAIASTYRALFTVAGGFTTARLAPDQAMHEVWILAAIGLLAGLAGVIVCYAIGGMTLGPAWYAISIPAEAIPCVWLGGRIALSRRFQRLLVARSANGSFPEEIVNTHGIRREV